MPAASWLDAPAPFDDPERAAHALRRSMIADSFGAGGVPRAEPALHPGALLTIRTAAHAAVRGTYGPSPGCWPMAFDEAAAALRPLGPFGRLLLRALCADQNPAIPAALDPRRQLGPATLIGSAGMRPSVAVYAPDAWSPSVDEIASWDMAVLPCGSAGCAIPTVRCYHVGSEAAVEEGDATFASAERWSRDLAARIGADDGYVEPVRRALKHAGAQRASLSLSVLGALRGCAHTARIALFAGREDWRPLAHDILAAGMAGAVLTVQLATTSLESRLAFVRHMAGLRAPQEGSDRASAPRRERRNPPILSGGLASADADTLVVGDLRAPGELRRGPTLVALLDRLQKQPGHVRFVEPWSARSGRDATRSRLRRLGLERVEPAAFLRRELPHPSAAAAAAPILREFGDSLAAEAGGGAFLLEAARKLASELPAARAAGAVVEAWARARPGRRCFLVQGGARFESSVCATACRRSGATTVEVLTTLSSASPRYDPPLADHVACLDTEQRRLMLRTMGMRPDRVHPVGAHELDLLRGASRRAADERATVVLYPAQGLPRFDAAAIRMIGAAQLQDIGLTLEVSPHPSMGARQKRALEDAVSDTLRWSEGDSLKRAIEADIRAVLTLFSNVGFRAAILGVDVVVLLLLGAAYPIRLDELGLARGAADPTSLRRFLAASESSVAARGAPYLEENPQLLCGSAVARIAALPFQPPSRG